MTITINLPPDVEQAFVAEAQAKGISLDEWLARF
jgi:predicted HicB family RNase H-like nuclease